METINFSVSGMTCGACVKHVEKAIASVDGVEKIEVDLASGSAKVQGNVNVAQIIAALEEDGYPTVVIMDIQGDKESNSSSCKSGGSCCCH